MIARVCGLEPEVAQRIVEVRERWGSGFENLEEVIIYASLSEREGDVLRDRGLLLP